ncbi:hypothetical protein DVH24_013950 [Malus domestica]|uniref:DUF4408 domain-containing protein n=1 Tax=Malus domestica TaxID=3750 RepID=A0A498JH57_MALDO|nr:hypothetical protein DVH24_013950 [Malus domestica]
MADSIPCKKPHFPFSDPNPEAHRNPIRHGKSYTMHFLLKALIFAVFIVVLPLFPSQAPEFINHTILTKFWELIHVIFVGIAVSYGLFSRRNSAEMGFENSSNVGTSESYMPTIFPVSSNFDSGYEHPCGYGEKSEGESWNSGYFVGNPVAAVAAQSCHESNVFYAQCKPSLGICESGCENSCGYKEKNVTQARNSQYFQGESMVFVAQPNYGLDEWGQPRSMVDNQPLGLPVRSLKPRVKNQDSFEFVAGSEFSLGSKGSFNSSDRISNGDFGDLGAINLKQKFNEAAASPSPVHWRSRSARMERGKRVGSNDRPSRLRPLSVDETQFESMKTRSFQSTLSFTSESSSQTSSMSSSPKEDSFTHSMSSEVLNSKVENVKKRKSPHSQGSSSPSGFASSPPKPMNEKASVSALHLRGYSIGSFHEEDLRRSSENYLKDLGGSGSRSRSRSGSGNGSGSEEEQLGSKELGQGFLGLNTKPASLTKSASRGKSVRTIRGSRFVTHEKVEKMCDIGEFISMRKDMMQNGVTNMKNLGNGKSKHDLGNPFHMPKLEFPKHEKKEMREVRGNAAAESEEEEPESEAENFQLSSDDEREDDALAAAAAATSSNSLNVGGADSEVDKKAGEFIAKFREQIRLQKVASKDRSRGQHISANSFGR